ncbi:MAG: hypothetical protein HC915_07945 [Anaerolineae bacterium]|nr:hypothetical protein [Anaerolineae bacterium]
MNTQLFQIGDLVRVRENVELIPLDKRAPSEVPAGIYGQIVHITENLPGEVLCWVEFPAPYEYANQTGLPAVLLDLVFRIPA